MNKPEDMFDIVQEIRLHTRSDGTTFPTYPWYLINKTTGEKYFPKTRPYGYSHYIQAKSARTKLYNSYMKAIEKDLLGGE